MANEILQPLVQPLKDAEAALESAKELLAVAREAGEDVTEQQQEVARLERRIGLLRTALEKRGVM